MTFDGLRKTVTVVRRVPIGRNAYGNTTHAETRIEVPGCLVAWGDPVEDRDNADRTVAQATVYDLDKQWPSGSSDRVEIDGQSWEVDGPPQEWPGSIGGTVVQLRKVRG